MMRDRFLWRIIRTGLFILHTVLVDALVYRENLMSFVFFVAGTFIPRYCVRTDFVEGHDILNINDVDRLDFFVGCLLVTISVWVRCNSTVVGAVPSQQKSSYQMKYLHCA